MRMPARILEDIACMSPHNEAVEQVEELLAAPELATALESQQFRLFLDQIPIAIIVSEMKEIERIVYANPQFEKVSGQSAAELEGQPWSALRGEADDSSKEGGGARSLGAAIVEDKERLGTFRIERAEGEFAVVDAYSNIIADEDDQPAYRLAALVDVHAIQQAQREEFEQRLRDKDILLQEIQHRVRNNLQIITTLIRLEARNAQSSSSAVPFDRLAGRIEALDMLYRSLAQDGHGDEIDLGIYLSQIASAVMRSHAVEGIRLDLKVDTYPVSINVAMPTGLVVNELLTNALKHAFRGRDGGTITLHSLVDGNGCRVVIADDGIGLPEGVEWPQRGKLSALIVQSLRVNAKAILQIESSPGRGMRVTILFTRNAAAPGAPG
jgi:PAS domain S-box-containing protein